MIKISVVIPVYNSEKYLKKCIDSVLAQSFTDIEVVAVDDGSSDSSLTILEQMAEADGRLKIYSKENGGVSSARNYGISKAQGEFISFVDSDDFLPLKALEILYSNVTDDIDLISGSYILEAFGRKYLTHDYMRVTADEKFTRFTEYDHTNWGPCGKLYRRSVIEEHDIRFDSSVTYGEDHIFNLNYTRVIKGDIVMLSDSVYIYNNKFRDNLCSKMIDDIAVSQKKLFEAVFHYFDGEQLDNSVKYRYLYGMLKGSLEHYLVFFPKSRVEERVRFTLEAFDEYMDEEFLNECFSPRLASLIEKKDYSEFVNAYIAEHSDIKKRRLKNAAKKILLKVLG